ncbi:uncharacterized protein [Ptychodera flava]|uniref:uncharacterized protein n=1 Tax=Ptychodera flava TaxID=63121 RepID=UPI00396A2A7D
MSCSSNCGRSVSKVEELMEPKLNPEHQEYQSIVEKHTNKSSQSTVSIKDSETTFQGMENTSHQIKSGHCHSIENILKRPLSVQKVKYSFSSMDQQQRDGIGCVTEQRDKQSYDVESSSCDPVNKRYHGFEMTSDDRLTTQEVPVCRSTTDIGSRGIDHTPSGKPRKNFKICQVTVLEQIFDVTHYPDQDLVEWLSRKLDISEQKLKVWFQNKRARWKKRVLKENVHMNEGTEVNSLPYMVNHPWPVQSAEFFPTPQIFPPIASYQHTSWSTTGISNWPFLNNTAYQPSYGSSLATPSKFPYHC